MRSRLFTMTDSIVAAFRTGEAEGSRDQLIGSAAGLVVVGDRHDHHLLGPVLLGHLLDVGADLLGRADHSAAGAAARAWRRGPLLLEEAERLLGRGHGDEPALA